MSARQTAVLLALDETLVLVGGLQLLRKRKNWPKVYAGFPQTELPPGTLAFIARLKALADVQLGVVTKSPRTYAERLLRFHTLEVPVLIAYHDVTRHKPHPNALIKADERLNIALERRVYIGDHPDDVAAVAAPCMAVTVDWKTGDGRNVDVAGETCGSWDAVYHRVIRIIEGRWPKRTTWRRFKRGSLSLERKQLFSPCLSCEAKNEVCFETYLGFKRESATSNSSPAGYSLVAVL